jgi:hypothetical protein
MAKGSNTGAIVILAILALGGLGLSGYLFIDDLFLGGDESNKLVAVWEELTGTGDDFNITFNDNQITANNYATLSNANTSISLNEVGWYKLTITTVWISLDSGNFYFMKIIKNGIPTDNPAYSGYPQESTLAISVVYFVFSDGDDIYTLNCQSNAGDSFSISANQVYNQMTLEFVVVA